MNTLAERLVDARGDLSQELLAKKAKVSQALIAALESGRQQSSGSLPEIGYALGLHAMWLKTGIGPKHIYSTAGESAATVLTASEPNPLETELMENVRKMDDRGLILLIDQAEQIARRHPREKKEAA
jgi:transcriptional regulator with XRE-family HTH domain